MKKASVLFSLLFICMGNPFISSGKELPRLAVWDLEPRNTPASHAKELTSILVSEIDKLQKYKVYSQENVRTLAGWTEERMKLGCTNTQCLTALGQMDVSKLISGSVGKIGNRYTISLNIFDTHKAEGEKAISEFCHSEDELIELVQVAVRRLLGAEVQPSREEAQVAVLKPQEEERRKIEEKRKKLEEAKQALAKERPLREPKSAFQAKPVELTYSVFFPASHKIAVLAREWAAEVEKRTSGQVKVTLYPGGTLTPADKCYNGVVSGISDIGMSVPTYTRGKFPLTEVIDLPLGYPSAAAATRMVNRYFQQFKPREFDEVKVLYFHANGPSIFHTRKAIHRLEDLKGMKIRSTGLSAKVVSVLGGTPVAVPMGEIYEAMRRGVVEGSLATAETLEGWKLGDLVKFTTQTLGSANSTAFFVVMNKEKWNALPADVQAIIENINKEWMEKTGIAWDEIDRSGRAYALKKGNQFLPLSSEENQRWAKAVRPILDEYVSTMKAKGLPGEEALKFCQGELIKGR